MKIDFTTEFVTIIKKDTWMLSILKTVRSLNLPNCWVGAGFVRNKIWDYKHNIKRTSLNDIDVVFFDKKNTSKTYELTLQKQLNAFNSSVNWSVKNQARMHIRNGHSPYKNCLEAISFWPETTTAIAIQLDSNNQINFIAPYGLDDLFNLIVRPTPNFDLTMYNNRIANKEWKNTWKKLSVYKQ